MSYGLGEAKSLGEIAEELMKLVENTKKTQVPGPDGYVVVPILRDKELVSSLIKGLPEGCYVAGGYARYVCSPNEKPAEAGDIDLFTTGPEAYGRLINRLRYEGIEGYKSKFIIETGNFIMVKFWDRPFQLVKPATVSGTPSQIISTFDFTVNRVILLNENEALKLWQMKGSWKMNFV